MFFLIWISQFLQHYSVFCFMPDLYISILITWTCWFRNFFFLIWYLHKMYEDHSVWIPYILFLWFSHFLQSLNWWLTLSDVMIPCLRPSKYNLKPSPLSLKSLSLWVNLIKPTKIKIKFSSRCSRYSSSCNQENLKF